MIGAAKKLTLAASRVTQPCHIAVREVGIVVFGIESPENLVGLVRMAVFGRYTQAADAAESAEAVALESAPVLLLKATAYVCHKGAV